MTVVTAKLAIPTAAGLGFQNHRQRFAVGRFVLPPELRDQGRERLVDRCVDVNVFGDGESRFDCRCRRDAHRFASACALMRRNCPRQYCSNKLLHSWMARSMSAL